MGTQVPALCGGRRDCEESTDGVLTVFLLVLGHAPEVLQLVPFVCAQPLLEESSDESEQDLSDGEAEVYRRMTGRGQV